jgi:hypothetical protein
VRSGKTALLHYFEERSILTLSTTRGLAGSFVQLFFEIAQGT